MYFYIIRNVGVLSNLLHKIENVFLLAKRFHHTSDHVTVSAYSIGERIIWIIIWSAIILWDLIMHNMNTVLWRVKFLLTSKEQKWFIIKRQKIDYLLLYNIDKGTDNLWPYYITWNRSFRLSTKTNGPDSVSSLLPTVFEQLTNLFNNEIITSKYINVLWMLIYLFIIQGKKLNF